MFVPVDLRNAVVPPVYMSSALFDIPNPPIQVLEAFCSCILFGPLGESEYEVSKTSLSGREWSGLKYYTNGIEVDTRESMNCQPISETGQVIKEIKIPIQGGLDPKTLLTDKENLKKEATKYLDVFKNHPYIFNLGHGVLPETDPNMMDYLIKLVKDY